MKSHTTISRITSYKNHFGSLRHLNTRADAAGLLKKLTVRRALNILRAVFDWKMGAVHVHSRPFVVSLEASARCNLRCPRCNTTRRFTEKSRRPTVMSIETFSVSY